MSNLDADPTELVCRADDAQQPDSALKVQKLTSREVPLGGPRAMTVYRTLPQRARSLIGPWCFADHYGPADVAQTGGMDVAPHPHTGLATVSWLFTGEIEHRDTAGNHAMVRPGEVNLMLAGHGIAHSEVSTPETTILHGVQLWLALPPEAADISRDFSHYVPPEITPADGLRAKVFLGELCGSTSPVNAYSPTLGAELHLAAGASVTLPVNSEFEHGVLVDSGSLVIGNAAGDDTESPLERTEMGYVGVGAHTLSLHNVSSEPARIVLLGGAPFPDEIIMWWNFVGRTHEEIAMFREEWMAQGERFGQVQGYAGEVDYLPAPTLPATRLRTRRNTPDTAH